MRIITLSAALAFTTTAALAQDSDNSDGDDGPLSSATFKGLKLRNIGPAFMSGRISDLEIVPGHPSHWYVGVGSGNVWKTHNAGTTWTPIFDDQSVYSIGDIALDPSNSSIVWVGTGENVGGRHVSFGDGVYRSRDGGQSWENLGLDESNHISKIIVHPEDSDTVWVAAQGPLWSSGGDRGVYKTTDGGETWDNVLSAGEWTGATDIVVDPRNPDRLYAALWQRHRTVAAYVGGGPETGIHISDDGGETWREVTKGLPDGNMGKIGLSVSHADPDVLYAAIETDRREGGVWRSDDRGESWSKKSDAVGGGTGPHYYQEIYASPHDVNRVYMVSNYTQVSTDGGATFTTINLDHKHVDDHAIAFREDDPDYILIGSDGGIYESYDQEENWRFIDNLPITQFYKVAVDDAEPFYFIYGGTQDNNTQGGPSRTDNVHGIRNSDWFVTLGGDGHQPATEPGNPDIMYSQWQQGNLTRVDRTTGERVYIQPQAAPGEAPERFNWDAPILVSSHDPARIYHASQRVWRSDNRGDSWEAISGDLTRNEDRMMIEHMDRQWSWDAPWDILAMSKYNTITSLAESPFNEDLIYAGTDDGLIQITEDGGESWREIEVSRLPRVPDRAFVNDIKADKFDEDTVYIALDNHKYGDYAPYLFKSTNRGRSWTSMSSNLPDKHLVWRIVQDHDDPDLFFVGTEFGVFFSIDAGENWVELEGGLPTIAFRDLAIQEREDDLVGATFGRGFYVLDDYSALREIDEDSLDEEALLFTGRPALWYIEQEPLGNDPKGSQGAGYFTADNPDFGATFTYYLRDGLKSLEDMRQEEEKPLVEEGEDTPFPGFDAVEAERRETDPAIWLTVHDAEGNVVRRISGPTGKGFHRVTWDLRYPAQTTVSPNENADNPPRGHLAAPGEYTVSLSQRVQGETTVLVEDQPFEVVRMREGALEGADPEDVVAFWRDLTQLQRGVSAANAAIAELSTKADHLKTALDRSQSAPQELDDQWQAIRDEIYDLEETMGGNQSRNQIGELTRATVGERVWKLSAGVYNSTYGPTAQHLEQYDYARDEFADIRERINTLRTETIPAFEQELEAIGAPWTPGGVIPPID